MDEEGWECIICYKSFESNDDLSDHLGNHIGISFESRTLTKSFICNVCKKTFISKNQLIGHLKTHDEHITLFVQSEDEDIQNLMEDSKPIDVLNKQEETVLLEKIDKLINEKIRYPELSCKIQDDVDDKDLSHCALCLMEFSSSIEMRKHLQQHISLKPFDCIICLMSFSNEVNLVKHIKTCKGIQKENIDEIKLKNNKKGSKNRIKTLVKCPNCSMTFNNRCHLRTHMRKHTGEKPHICSICQRGFASKTNLSKHLRYHVGIEKYTCPYCSKGFIQNTALTIHLRKHTGDKPYQCPICLKKFPYKRSRDYHVMAHNNEYNFKCDKCDKTFIRKDNFKSHLRIHYNVRPFNCNECLKSFTTKTSLKIHLNTHSKQESVCEICSAIFDSKIKLRQHRKKSDHQKIEEKLYHCDQCPKAFSREASLKMHNTVHSSCRPFSCSFCLLYFSRKSELIRHTNTIHIGLKFTCELCNKNFTRKNRLNYHVRKEHPQ